MLSDLSISPGKAVKAAIGAPRVWATVEDQQAIVEARRRGAHDLMMGKVDRTGVPEMLFRRKRVRMAMMRARAPGSRVLGEPPPYYARFRSISVSSRVLRILVTMTKPWTTCGKVGCRLSRCMLQTQRGSQTLRDSGTSD